MEGIKVNGNIVLTRSREDNERTARVCVEAGFRPISLPVLEYRYLDVDEAALPPGLNECLVLLTSARATRRWLELRFESRRFAQLTVVAYLVVGSRSVNLLRDAEPDVKIWRDNNGIESLQEDIQQAMRAGDISTVNDVATTVLYPCSTLRRDVAVENLELLGFNVVELPLYEPIRAADAASGIRDLISAKEPRTVFTFHSPSSVRFFIAGAKEAGVLEQWKAAVEGQPDKIVAAIGSTTAEELYAAGVSDVIVPEHPELALMCDAIKARFSRQN